MHARALAALGILALLTTAAGPGLAGTFVVGGTAVARGFGSLSVNGVTVNGVDDGVLVCAAHGSAGVGGVCLPAPAGADNAVFVTNEVGAATVAFQVCIDHNQDNLCSFGNSTAGCPDDLFFSHDDLGLWHNPLGGPGVLAKTLQCPGQAWDGQPSHWLVFICNGLHQSQFIPGGAHAHPTNEGSAVTRAIANADTGGIELGFCQPNDSISAKAYRMV